MNQLVSFPLKDGGTVLVEVDERFGSEPSALDQPARRGLGRSASDTAESMVVSAGETLESTIGAIQPAVQAVATALIAGVNTPETVEVQFGIQLSGTLGAIFAQAAGEANFTVKLSWARES